jgi:NAD(P)H-hydrate epimerase
VAIELIKRGMLQFPAREMCGDIIAAPIGILHESGGEGAAEFRAVSRISLSMMTRRDAAVHKGTLGRVLIVGGSLGMPGAAILSALGALRAGAGLVTRITRAHWSGPSVPPECMNLMLKGDQQSFVKEDLGAIVDACRVSDVVVIGPGIGVSAAVKELLGPLLAELKQLRTKTVLDADALNVISAAAIDLRGLNAVITPHPGEAARLLGCDSAAIQNDRFGAVRALWERYGVVAVLKGAGTLVYSDDHGVVVPRGTPYLATPGSGDVLSGIVATTLHRCGTCFDAAVLGAWIHAVAGERASRAVGGPILASDIAFSTAAVVGELERL